MNTKYIWTVFLTITLVSNAHAVPEQKKDAEAMARARISADELISMVSGTEKDRAAFCGRGDWLTKASIRSSMGSWCEKYDVGSLALAACDGYSGFFGSSCYNKARQIAKDSRSSFKVKIENAADAKEVLITELYDDAKFNAISPHSYKDKLRIYGSLPDICSAIKFVFPNKVDECLESITKIAPNKIWTKEQLDDLYFKNPN